MVGMIGSYSFSISGGSATTNTELDAIDLSRAKSLRIEAFLTGKGSADAGDTLDIYFQEASDDVTPTWDDRAHLGDPGDTTTFDGSLTVSAAAPEKRVNQIMCVGLELPAASESYEPSGSAGGSHLAVGEVIKGLLKGKRYFGGAIAARHRLSFVNVDANANATWTGTVKLYIDSCF